MTENFHDFMEPMLHGMSVASPDSHVDAMARFSQNFESRKTPIADLPESVDYEFYWPVKDLVSIALPGGVTLLDDELEFNQTEKIDYFYQELEAQEIFFWAVEIQNPTIYSASMNPDTRWWIKRNIIYTPTVIISRDVDLFILSDERWRVSVIGAPIDIMSVFFSMFGGGVQLRKNFERWVELGGVGFGPEGKDWAERFPISWSDWN